MPEAGGIIAGGAAAVIHGAPITTNDLDIVHRRTPENVTRLLEVLLGLDAVMRYDFARRGRAMPSLPGESRRSGGRWSRAVCFVV